MKNTIVVQASSLARNAKGISKSMFAKVAALGLLAGAVAFAAPTQASAQVSFGVRVGPPVLYGRPGYVRPYPVYGGAYYAAPAYRPYGYDRDRFHDRDYDRDHDRRDFDRDRDHHDRDRRDWR
jgi:hypothetical protein